MQKRYLLALFLGAYSFCSGQNYWSAGSYFGQNFVIGDFSEKHPTRNVAPSVGLQLGYAFNPYLTLNGDISYSGLTGGGFGQYFESNMFNSQAELNLNLFELFQSKSKFHIDLGVNVGWSFINAKKYSESTGAVLANVPNKGSFSNVPFVGGNLKGVFNATENVDLFLAFRGYYMIEYDYLDAFKSGEANDYFAQVNLGLTYHFGNRPGKPSTKVDKKEYDQLASKNKELENEKAELKEELNSTKEKMQAQLDDMYLVMSIMKNNIDSLNQKVTVLKSVPNSPGEYVVRGSKGSAQPSGNTATSSSANPNGTWRIVVGSFPSEKMAREFAAQQIAGTGDYEIVFIEDLKTFRVVYKNYETLEAAKKELNEVRRTVAKAWIIKF